jgi:uncharacterized protein (TIGR04255 family)
MYIELSLLYILLYSYSSPLYTKKRGEDNQMKGTNPFTGPEPQEVHLSAAPLVKVLSQIRFSSIASIDKKEFIAPFQEAIRHNYPKLEQDQGVEVSFSPRGGSFSNKVIWRMLDKNQQWRVSIGENFLSLETSLYPGREVFLRALKEVIEKLQSTIKPDLVDRIGLRYINRILFNSRDRLAALLQPGVLGIVDDTVDEYLNSSFTETRFFLPDGLKVHGKWGLLPGNQSYDPTVLPPVDKQSWILDIDGIMEINTDFEAENILDSLNRLADIDYRLFRFTVTENFLREYGGNV